jgi:hypothetical protein
MPLRLKPLYRDVRRLAILGCHTRFINGKIDREALMKCIGTEKVRKISDKPQSNPYLEISNKGITPPIRYRDIAFI